MIPYYDEDGITIYHGACGNLVGDLSFDSVVTDPPYGVNAENKPHGVHTGDRAWWDDQVPYDLIERFAPRPTLWFGAAPKIGEAFGPTGFPVKPDRVLMWAPRFTLSMASSGGIAYRYHPIYAWGLPKQSPTVHDVLTDPTECGNWWNHQATKPLTLMARLVAMVDGVILDPFVGSGTTLVAAKAAGKRAIGIEINEAYCEIAVKRLAQGVLDFGATR